MKIRISREQLTSELAKLQGVVSQRSTLAILSNALFDAADGTLKLDATDLDINVSTTCPCEVIEPGKVTLQAKAIFDIVKNLEEDDIEIETEENYWAKLKAGCVNCRIVGTHPDDFPQVLDTTDVEMYPIGAERLLTLIEKTLFSVSTDDARPVLTGVLIEVNGGEMTLAAADGFRLSVRTAHLTPPAAAPIRAIIPARALSELARVISDGEQTVSLALPSGRGQAIFRSKNAELVSQLIEGTFPDFRGIIPTSHTTRSVLSTSAFLKACKAADIFAREAAHSARLRITPRGELEPGTLEVSATAAQTGSNETRVDATIEGNPLEIAFNVRYLLDVLGVIDTPNVALETTGPAAPGLLRPVGRDDFLHVIMPMHLGR